MHLCCQWLLHRCSSVLFFAMTHARGHTATAYRPDPADAQHNLSALTFLYFLYNGIFPLWLQIHLPHISVNKPKQPFRITNNFIKIPPTVFWSKFGVTKFCNALCMLHLIPFPFRIFLPPTLCYATDCIFQYFAVLLRCTKVLTEDSSSIQCSI